MLSVSGSAKFEPSLSVSFVTTERPHLYCNYPSVKIRRRPAGIKNWPHREAETECCPFFAGATFVIFPRDSGMVKNPRIHPIWSQINGKIANKTIHPLCKNIDEAQIVALAFRALGQMQKFLAELALAIPTQAPRAPRRRIEALQPCLLLSKMIFPVVTSSNFHVSNISSNSFYCLVLSPSQYICWRLISGDTIAAPLSPYSHPLFLGS